MLPANLIVEPFGTSALAGDITLPIPVASQIAGGNPGRASFTDGFPPANFTPVGSGGIPPSGKDFNGLLYMITAYLASAQAGESPIYDAAASTAFGGYAVGAILRATSFGGFWVNGTANNTTDPDSGGAGWTAVGGGGGGGGLPTGLISVVPASGSTNNYAPAGYDATTGFIDLNPSSGSATITGLVAGTNGQFLTITNIHASNTVTLSALGSGSSAANRFRLPGDLTLVQNNSTSFRYSTGVNLWVPV